MGVITSASFNSIVISLELAARRFMHVDITDRVLRIALAVLSLFAHLFPFWRCRIEAITKPEATHSTEFVRTSPIPTPIPQREIAFCHPKKHPFSEPCSSLDDSESEEEDSDADKLIFELEL